MIFVGAGHMVPILKKAVRILRTIIAVPLGFVRRLFPTVRSLRSAADPVADSKLEAVYVHYDRYGVVHDFVLTQLRALVEAGFRVTFVTNSPKFEDRAFDLVAPMCRQVLWRWNAGYDFGGYKDGLKAVGALDGVQQLIIMNDSVYGPFWSLRELLARISPEIFDVWGITDSWEHAYHVQSYFMLFFRPALQSEGFKSFWERLPYCSDKPWIIKHGEVKLTQVLTRQKLRSGVLCPYWDVVELVNKRLDESDAAPKQIPWSGQSMTLSEWKSFSERMGLGETIPVPAGHNLGQGPP